MAFLRQPPSDQFTAVLQAHCNRPALAGPTTTPPQRPHLGAGRICSTFAYGLATW